PPVTYPGAAGRGVHMDPRPGRPLRALRYLPLDGAEESGRDDGCGQQNSRVLPGVVGAPREPRKWRARGRTAHCCCTCLDSTRCTRLCAAAMTRPRSYVIAN